MRKNVAYLKFLPPSNIPLSRPFPSWSWLRRNFQTSTHSEPSELLILLQISANKTKQKCLSYTTKLTAFYILFLLRIKACQQIPQFSWVSIANRCRLAADDFVTLFKHPCENQTRTVEGEVIPWVRVKNAQAWARSKRRTSYALYPGYTTQCLCNTFSLIETNSNLT